MKELFHFGEQVKGYPVRVLNEREARAAAGILFVLALLSFMNAFLLGQFVYIKAFIIMFFIDFTIRVLVNPAYAPTLILARLIVSGQEVEYVGAPQKRFAWALGFVLSAAMLFVIVIYDVRGYVNLGVCLLCLTLLFFETAFGICIGCKLYNVFNKEKAQLCPGGACRLTAKEDIQKVSAAQLLILAGFFVVVGVLIVRFVLPAL